MDQITTEKDISASECSSNSSWDESSTSVSSVSLKDSSRQFESTKITTEIIKLPKDLCEDQAIFREFFSLDTWNCLSNPIQKHLCSFLPMFTGTIDYEILNTIEALFSNKITRFDYCPLKKLQKDVEECYCKPEIALLHASVSKAERREQRFQECDRLGSLAHKVYVSREKVLQEVYHSAGYPILSQMYDPEDLIYSTTALRAKKRFLREIASVTEQFGGKDVLSDEDAGISNVLPRRQRRLFGTQQGCISSSGTDNRIANTFAYKDDHPTTGHLIGPNGKFFISDHYYRNILVCHKRRKIEEPQNDSEATVSRSKTGINIHPITDMNNTVSVANVQQSILTPAQQKQILQNLLAQQNKQVLVPRCLTGLQSVYTSTNTTSSNFIRGTKTVAKQLHEMSTLELSNLVSTPAVLLQSIDTDVASSHVFHIRPSNAIISGTTEANINMPNATQNETKHKQKFPISRYTIQNDELKILPSSKAVANQKPSSVLISSVTSETAITRAIKSATFVSQPALGTLRTSLTNNIGQNASQVTGKVVKTVGDCQISSLDSLLPQKRLSSEIGIRFAEQKTQSTHLENNLTNIDKNAVLTSNSSIISAVPSFNKDTTQVLVTSTANNLLGPKTAQVCNANQISTVDGMTMLGENENRLNKDTSSNTEHVFGKTTRTSRNIATTIGGTSCINSHSDLRLIEDNPILIASKSSVEIDAVQQKSSNIGFQKAISPSNLLNIRYSEQTKNVQGNITSQANSSVSQKLLLGNHLMKMRTVPRQHNQMQLSFSKQPSGDVAITSVPTSVHHLANISVKGVSPDHQEKSLFNTLSLKGSAATSGEETVSKVGIRMNQQMQRVVLASQGRHIVTQQIIVPSTFQTGPFNIKHLKVIPVNSQQKGSKVNSPSNVTVPHINSPTAITVSNAAGETSSEVIPIHNTSVSDSVDMSNAVELSHDSNSM
ncbi:uncharacterized protein LOC131693122 isoform X4 [Topomyia yanbarensis]|uniref:uncharacterized protein LOC131693122 isoform X4 n=1 Tax=Topomyia yanbarensis TaxID=2498891 RepID=UPI00273AC1B8|nr:uncharacterized protein LOC131693122 isoform X4 [Topomyia yanbarensis]